jgi:glycosyltransferase involved in cell wall biosynthesis
MRIALDGLPLTETLTGVGHYTLELVTHLANSFEDDEFIVVSPRPFLRSIDKKTNRCRNLRFIRSTVNPITRYWWSIGLPRYIRKNEIDLFHGTNFEVPLGVACPRVLTIHDLSHLLHPETFETRIVRRSRRRLPLMARAATMIVTPTEAVRGEVHEYLGIPLARLAAVPEASRAGVAFVEEEKSWPIRQRFGIADNFLLYVGTIEPRKNLLTLVRAFEQVRSRRPSSLQLVLAGRKGWMVDDLFRYLKQSSGAGDVIFTGYVTDNELSALYSSCSLFVYPSLYEGFGLPPLEAMVCGAPVIASRIPSLSEVVGSAARLVTPNSVEELTAAIVELLDDVQQRQELSVAGKRRVAQFSWANTAREVHKVYEQAINLHQT